MDLYSWRPSRASKSCLVILFLLIAAFPGFAVEKSRFRVDDYQIDVELQPHAHKMTARAKVKLTALEDVNVATFEFNNALRINKVTDSANKPLTPERFTQDSAIRVALPATLAKDATTTLTFDYDGILETADESPVQGLKLAYIGDDTSYLLYAGRWFPVNAYGINRFTATINVTLPAHMIVIGSGKPSVVNTTPGEESDRRSTSHKNVFLHMGQGKFPRHDHCRAVSGIQKRRGRSRHACLLQAHASSVCR